MDTLRNTMSNWGPTIADQSFVRKFEEALPEALGVEALKEVTDTEGLSEKFFERKKIVALYEPQAAFYFPESLTSTTVLALSLMLQVVESGSGYDD